jgi:glycosyltransferase involved in cell wall biosynthesis
MTDQTSSADPGSAPTVAFFVTVDWYFHRHYRVLASAVRDAGYRVVVITGVGAHGEAIRQLGFELVPIEISRKGMHPVREFGALLRLARVLRRVEPDLLHSIAQKPVLYGSLAARILGTRAVVAALPGLGWLFSSNAGRARLGRQLVMLGYRWLLRRPNVRALVQNRTDRAELKRVGKLDAVLIPGSGVDLERFVPRPPTPGPVTILLASRLLWDKGIGELVEAARLLHGRGAPCRCVLVGAPDEGNPASVTLEKLDAWNAEGVIEWWGYRADMADVLGQAHIACLPSYYREGIPKFLLEAAACGLPIVTTDMPGCRETVEPGVNGLLVPPRDPTALADALQRLVLNADLRSRFGANSRTAAESKFGDARIAEQTLAVYAELLDSTG